MHLENNNLAIYSRISDKDLIELYKWIMKNFKKEIIKEKNDDNSFGSSIDFNSPYEYSNRIFNHIINTGNVKALKGIKKQLVKQTKSKQYYNEILFQTKRTKLQLQSINLDEIQKVEEKYYNKGGITLLEINSDHSINTNNNINSPVQINSNNTKNEFKIDLKWLIGCIIIFVGVILGFSGNIKWDNLFDFISKLF